MEFFIVLICAFKLYKRGFKTMNESKFCIDCEEFRSGSYCNGERTNCMKTLFSIIKDLKEENKYLKNKLYIKEKSLQELIKKYEEFFKDAKNKLDIIKETEYNQLDKNSKSEYDGLKNMFDMLASINLKELKNK